jgi:hypothetical protein
MDLMTLHKITIQYLIYLKALRMPARRLQAYQRVLADVELFYGPDAPIQSFDNSRTLEYIQENDPFDTDPLKVERGAIFCKFTHWLMKIHLIPAWAGEMRMIEEEEAYFAACEEGA